MDSSPLFAILPSSCSSSWMVFFLFETDGRDSSCWEEVGSVYGSFFDPSFTSFTGDTAAIFSSICKDKEKLLLGCYNNHSNHDKTYVIEWKMSLLNPCRMSVIIVLTLTVVFFLLWRHVPSVRQSSEGSSGPFLPTHQRVVTRSRLS